MDEAETDAATSALRAAAHPVRLRMLSLLTGTAMSAAEVARELDLTHANASYHLRQLLDADELVVDSEEKIRGGVAKRYRYPHERRGENPTKRPTTSDDQVFYAAGCRHRGRASDPRASQGHPQHQQRPRGLGAARGLGPRLRPPGRGLDAPARPQRCPAHRRHVHVSSTSWAFQMEQRR